MEIKYANIVGTSIKATVQYPQIENSVQAYFKTFIIFSVCANTKSSDWIWVLMFHLYYLSTDPWTAAKKEEFKNKTGKEIY